ncbi:MAG: 2-oxoacid:acceptor oxidoreductase subunit alpha [Caldisericia bacterium]|nr:2-oxoacid:acceptor oxidoreductase subunit alpha [Caldisericia bacterium]
MREFLQGNEACAYGAIDGGLDFFAGYPITPSSEILEVLSYELPRRGKIFIQMEDEIASICAVIGASLTGKRALTATSGPGFSLMQEALGYACMTEAPCVIVNVMRGGPSTGLPTNIGQGDYMQAKWGTHGDHPIIIFSPGTVNEFYHLTKISFDVAFYYRNPVIILSDEIVAHMRSLIDKEDKIFNFPYEEEPLSEKSFDFEHDLYRKPFVGEGKKIKITGLFHDESGFPTTNSKIIEKNLQHLIRKINQFKEKINFYETDINSQTEIVLVGFGIMGIVVKELKKELKNKGLNVGFYRPITLNPIDEDMIKEIFKNVKKVLVIELNMGQLYLDIKRILCDKDVKSITFFKGDLPDYDELISSIEENL